MIVTLTVYKRIVFDLFATNSFGRVEGYCQCKHAVTGKSHWHITLATNYSQATLLNRMRRAANSPFRVTVQQMNEFSELVMILNEYASYGNKRLWEDVNEEEALNRISNEIDFVCVVTMGLSLDAFRPPIMFSL